MMPGGVTFKLCADFLGYIDMDNWITSRKRQDYFFGKGDYGSIVKIKHSLESENKANKTMYCLIARYYAICKYIWINEN